MIHSSVSWSGNLLRPMSVLILLPSLLVGMLLFHVFDRRRPHGAGEEKLAAR